MGETPQYKKMSSKEKVVCHVLCACLAAAVLSAVAMVYLTVIVYLPARRELGLGLGSTPVVCTTVEKRHVTGDIEACKWTSCTEWCLSRGGGDCTHLFVAVRSNGSRIDFEGCELASTKRCPTLEDRDEAKASAAAAAAASPGTTSASAASSPPASATSRNDFKNCKEDHQCTRLDRMFQCEDGLCRNISGVQACSYDLNEDADRATVSCAKKRNCVELTGMFDCTRGRCRQVHRWRCERRCSGIPVGGGRNLVVQSGDHVTTARCDRAVDRDTGEVVWEADDDADEEAEMMLAVHCTDFDIVDGGYVIRATDCINGTKVPRSDLVSDASEQTTNLTALRRAAWLGGARPGHLRGAGYARRLDPENSVMPFESDLTIFNKSRLRINSEGCVNTLVYECASFYRLLGRDGRNQSSPARFPCHYAPGDTAFGAVRRYDPDRTKRVFLVFFMAPAAVLCFSCGSLFVCSRILNIDNGGHMVFRCCHEGDLDAGDSDSNKIPLDDLIDEDGDEEERMKLRRRERE